MTRCCCARAGATQLDLLDHLINDRGHDQVTACQWLWGPTQLAAQIEEGRSWVRDRATELYAALAVRDTEGGVEDQPTEAAVEEVLV